MDYGAIPPEINAARIYSGPGSGSWLAAAASWDGLATELYSTAAGYQAVISGLTSGWLGSASASMASAAAPFVAWLTTTATQAQQAASSITAATSGFEVARAMTVPLALIAANRTQLMSLVANNILGQNSPAIAATEADYGEMWAQNAAAMYGYAASSATASQLSPFSSPPATTNPAALAGQGTAIAQAAAAAASHGQEIMAATPELMSAVQQALQGLASMSSSSSVSSALSKLTELSSFTKFISYAQYPMSFLMRGMSMAKTASTPAAAAAATAAGVKAVGSEVAQVGSGTSNVSGLLGLSGLGTGGKAFSAGLGRALSIGPMSVPHAWTNTAAPINPISPIGAQLPAGTVPSAAAAGNPAGMPVMPITSMSGRGQAGATTPRFEMRPSVIPRSPAAG